MCVPTKTDFWEKGALAFAAPVQDQLTVVAEGGRTTWSSPIRAERAGVAMESDAPKISGSGTFPILPGEDLYAHAATQYLEEVHTVDIFC